MKDITEVGVKIKKAAKAELVLNSDEGAIPINVEFRRIKNVNIYIKPPKGDVLVTAPGNANLQSIADFVRAKADWIIRARQKVISRGKAPAYENEREVTQEERERLYLKILEIASHYEKKMGVKANRFSIRRMKTRWGSCTIDTGNIRINERLALYPVSSLEYIVVHELCHLLEPSHNARFQAFMTQYLPDWKERRAYLRNRSK